MNQTAIAFLLAFVVVNGLAIFRNPVFGVLAYVSLVFVDPPSRWWGHALPDLRWSLIAGVATVVGMMIHKPRPPEIPFLRQGAFILLLLFLIWAAIQSFWALDAELHGFLLNYYVKYAIAMFLIYRCVDSEKHLRWLMWTFVGGCGYLAWVAYFGYKGGRFDEFGGAGIGEANAGALTLVLGIFVASALFLDTSGPKRWILVLIVPFLANSLIMTVSRSGFLALAAGGLAFILFTPSRFRGRVTVLSALAVGAFMVLANPGYWSRIESVKYKGEEVQGLDTGSGRLNIIRAQVQMFREHPLGCGHHCTEVLSPYYLEEKDLARGTGRRASHNTGMSMLVEHGIPGGIYYVLLYIWGYASIRRLRRGQASLSSLQRALLPGLAACLTAELVADQFVPYVRYEVRFWILTALMVSLNLAARQKVAEVAEAVTGDYGRGDTSARRVAPGSRLPRTRLPSA